MFMENVTFPRNGNVKFSGNKLRIWLWILVAFYTTGPSTTKLTPTEDKICVSTRIQEENKCGNTIDYARARPRLDGRKKPDTLEFQTLTRLDILKQSHDSPQRKNWFTVTFLDRFLGIRIPSPTVSLKRQSLEKTSFSISKHGGPSGFYTRSK